MQSDASIIGELWVTYAVKFFKPQLSTLAENPLAVFEGYTDWGGESLIMNSPTEEFNTIGSELSVAGRELVDLGSGAVSFFLFRHLDVADHLGSQKGSLQCRPVEVSVD